MESQMISSETLYEWITDQHRDIFILDLRETSQYERFQLDGPELYSRNIFYEEYIADFDEHSKIIPTDKRTVVICANGIDAEVVAKQLQEKGFHQIYWLEKGIRAWGDMLYPKPVRQSDDWALYQFIRPAKASCSYGLISKQEMYLFDPCRNTDFYTNFAKQKGVEITQVFETHLQADYVSGGQAIAARHNAVINAHENDFVEASFSYHALADGESFFPNGPEGVEVKVIHSPGHTPGSVMFLIDDTHLISGDTVFIRSIGRPDLGGQLESWSDLLYQTLHQIVRRLSPNLIVLPGHFSCWKEMNQDHMFSRGLGRVLEENKQIYELNSNESFRGFIRDNQREQPKEYAEIRRINAGLLSKNDEELEIMDLGKNQCSGS